MDFSDSSAYPSRSPVYPRNSVDAFRRRPGTSHGKVPREAGNSLCGIGKAIPLSAGDPFYFSTASVVARLEEFPSESNVSRLHSQTTLFNPFKEIRQSASLPLLDFSLRENVSKVSARRRMTFANNLFLNGTEGAILQFFQHHVRRGSVWKRVSPRNSFDRVSVKCIMHFPSTARPFVCTFEALHSGTLGRRETNCRHSVSRGRKRAAISAMLFLTSTFLLWNALRASRNGGGR